MSRISSSHWFEAVADHLGEAYLRYSFTQGTDQEADFLVDALDLSPDDRVLDVGCGPGRHAAALAARGMRVHGVDISARFVDLARERVPDATFERADARRLDFGDDFDAAYSLCQGAFGILGGPGADDDPEADDLAVLRGMARGVRPGGKVGVSAFSAAFGLTRMGTDGWDHATGVHHERTTIRDEAGRPADADLWTTWFTPRELRLLACGAGLEPLAVWSVTPGGYARRPPDPDHEELFLLARVPTGELAG